jgi:hypothetical protein
MSQTCSRLAEASAGGAAPSPVPDAIALLALICLLADAIGALGSRV